jgi:hypothetical protein
MEQQMSRVTELGGVWEAISERIDIPLKKRISSVSEAVKGIIESMR